MDNTTTTMGPDSDSGGEAIVICIDHTTDKEYLDAQLEAVRSYATYKIQSHPRTVVGLLTTTPELFRYRFFVRPTRHLAELFDSFKRISRGCSFDVVDTISYSLLLLTYKIPKGLQKRMVLFAGGFILMDVEAAAKPIKFHGVAVDVVNFTLDDELGYRKEKLEALVSAVNNDDGKSHIIHVKEGSSLSNLLSSFMPSDAHVEANRMKNKDHQLIEKAIENENVDVKQPSSSFMPSDAHAEANRMKNKDHQLIQSKKAIENENVDVKQPSSSVMAKGVKNKNELIHLKKTTRLSSQNRFEALSGTENENVDVKGVLSELPSSSVMAKGVKNKNELIHLKKTTRLSSQNRFEALSGTENENVDVKGVLSELPSSSVMAKGMKNKNELNHLKKTTRPSRQKKATENENVSSKGAVGHEHVKNAPSKHQNRLKHSRSLGQGWLMQICLIVSILAALLMCAA